MDVLKFIIQVKFEENIEQIRREKSAGLNIIYRSFRLYRQSGGFKIVINNLPGNDPA
jgi:hypothetical protein